MKIFKVLLLIVLLLILILPFYAFDDKSFSNAQYTNLKFYLRFILFFIIIKNFNFLKIKIFSKFSSFKFYLVYVIIALISILFSPDKLYSTIKFSEILAMLMTSIIIVNKYVKNLYDIPKIIFIIIGFYIISFLIIANTFYPSLYRLMGYDGSLRLGGGLVNPNLLGYCMAISFISLEFIKIKYNKYIIITVQLFLIYGIYLTLSRSVIVFFIIYLFINFVYRKKVFLALIILVLMFFSKLIYNNFIESFTRGEGFERVLSFSGRIPIWKELISIYKFDIYSLFGHGFQMLSENGLGIKINNFGATHSTELTMAHNNFIQVLFGMGILGLIFSILVLIKLYSEILLIPNIRLLNFFRHTFWAIFTFSFVEFGVYGSPNILTLVFSIFIFATYKHVRPKIN